MFLSLLEVPLEGHEFPSSFPAAELETTAHSQRTIGMYHMAIGLLSTKWTTALGTLGMDHPKNAMSQVLSMTWDHICKAL